MVNILLTWLSYLTLSYWVSNAHNSFESINLFHYFFYLFICLNKSISSSFLIELSIQLANTGNEIEYESECTVSYKKIEQYDISFSNTFSKDRTMMIILFTTSITKSTMFCTYISIYFTCNTVDSLLRKRLFFIIKDSPWIKKEQTRI